MTRETDVRVDKQIRGLLASEVPHSVLVSLHFNQDRTHTARGLETYAMTPMGVKSSNDSRTTVEAGFGFQGNLRDSASLALAAAVHSQILHRTGCEDRGVRRARFAVLKDSERAGILIEAGYLSHPEEGALINQPEYRDRLAIGDRRGRSPLSPGHRPRALTLRRLRFAAILRAVGMEFPSPFKSSSRAVAPSPCSEPPPPCAWSPQAPRRLEAGQDRRARIRHGAGHQGVLQVPDTRTERSGGRLPLSQTYHAPALGQSGNAGQRRQVHAESAGATSDGKELLVSRIDLSKLIDPVLRPSHIATRTALHHGGDRSRPWRSRLRRGRAFRQREDVHPGHRPAAGQATPGPRASGS